MNAAIREGLLRDNPARYIELPTPRRPRAQVWTEERVEAWRQTGDRPAVAVWNTNHVAEFLTTTTTVADDRLSAMW